jgi:leader peptidase (prepilin peptidase)/N-methyltransferase
MPQLISGLLFVGALILASVCDLRERIIPYLSCILLVVAGLINFSPANLFGITLAIPLAFVTKNDAIGWGDVQLVAAAGFVLGFWRGAAGLAATVCGLVLFTVADRLVQRIQGKPCPKRYPLAPFLSVGFIAAYFIL